MILKDSKNLYCSCGCNDGVVIKTTTDDDSWCELSLVSDVWYTSQKTSFERFKEKCKRIWAILRNKEYRYFSIYVEPDDIAEFKEFVSQI